MNFQTPDALASALARHAPRKVHTILEPAVGRGDLLRPFVVGHERELSKVVCVDNDRACIKHVKGRFISLSQNQLTAVAANFLEWHSLARNLVFHQYFDCVVMNPPFGGRMASLKRVDGDCFITPMEFSFRMVPIEIAFFAAAVQLVRSGGTILAILPASTISAESTKWFRNYLFQVGSVRFVHELPRRSFPGVDGSFYFVVFERDRRRRHLRLANHNITDPELLDVKTAQVKRHLRLDYAFNSARLRQQQIAAARLDLSWTPLHKLALISRGRIPAPFECPCLHSTSFVGNRWVVPEQFSATGHACAIPGDILAVRVSRRCYDSFSMFDGVCPVPCSDCILIIRPTSMPNLNLLFALRVCLASEEDASLIVHGGTGARYMTVSSLCNILIPARLSIAFRKAFLCYSAAVQSGNRPAMLTIEADVRGELAASPGIGSASLRNSYV